MATLNPQEIIDILRRLQAIDDEIHDVRAKRDGMVSNLSKLQKVLQLREAQLEEMRAKLAEAETWHRKKSSELEDERDKLAKAKVKLSGVTRNREYLAAQRELDNARRNIQSREDEVEKLTLAIEEFRSTIERETEKVRDLRAAADNESATSRDRLDQMERRIADVEIRRQQVCGEVDKAILRRYQKVFDAREGRAVVKIVGESCGGCHMNVQARDVEAVLRGTSLAQCRFCSCFLYIETTSDENGDPVVAA